MTLAERLALENWGGAGYDAYDGEMFIGTALAIGLAATAAAGSVGGAAIAAHGAGQAAGAQVDAANHAADIQHQDAQAALAENQRQFGISQQNIAPWLTTGRSGLANLAYQLGILPNSGKLNGPTGPTSVSPFPPTGTQSKLRSGSGFDGGITASPAVLAAGAGNPSSMASQFGFDQNSDRSMSGVRDGRALQMMEANQNPEGSNTLDASGNPVPADSGGGTVDLSSLVNPDIGAPGSLTQDFTEKFQAPTDVTEQNDPGYKFRLQQGQDAIQRSAAARGGLLTGGTAKDLDTFSQGDASNEYSNVYNRAFNDYSTRYNVFKQNQADRYNKLAAMSGTGQVAAGQLATLGTNEANNNANILLTSGQQIGQNINNAGAARASGYAAGANAYGGAFSGISNNLTSLAFLSQMHDANGNPLLR